MTCFSTLSRRFLGWALLAASLGTSCDVSAQNARLYFFTQAGCAPCARMEPAIDALIQQGLAVTKVDVRLQPEWAKHFQITQTPTTILADEQQVLGRHSGPLDPSQLNHWVQRLQPASAPTATPHSSADLAPLNRPRSQTIEERTAPAGGLANTAAAGSAESQAMASTVRLRLERDQDVSFATGTVIHTQGTESLVLTCGHIFRDSAGQGRLTADVGWHTAQPYSVNAQLLDYTDDGRDVALVVIRSTAPLTAVPLARSDWSPVQGQSVFSIGCDRGEPPTIRRSQIKNIARYNGAVKYDTVGRPVVGRSGGGLFNEQGELIGVCNAAAVEVDEGIYSSIENVHWQLAKVNLSGLIQGSSLAQAESTLGRDAQPARRAPPISTVGHSEEAPPVGRAVVSATAQEDQSAGSFAGEAGDRWEAIVVLRDPQDPASTRAYALSNPSPALLAAIRAEWAQQEQAQRPLPSHDPMLVTQAPQAAGPTNGRATQGHDSPSVRPTFADPVGPSREAAIRAQSPR